MSWNTLSKYRNELFGICIIGVLAGHAVPNFSNVYIQCVCKLLSIIGVRGFIFLSGFGAYYALKKIEKNEIFYYYKRRLFRVYIPYIIIGCPFFIYYLSFVDKNFFKILSFIFPVYFWIYGNDLGLWYIDFILLFYMFIPFIFKWLKMCWNRNLIILITVSLVANLFLGYANSSYYKMTEIALSKIPLIFVGIYCARLSEEKKKCNMRVLTGIFILWILLYLTVDKSTYIYTFLCDLRSLLSCLVFCNLLEHFDFKCIRKLLTKIGSVSLELYLTHIFVGHILEYIGREMGNSVLQKSDSRYILCILLSIIISFLFSHCYSRLRSNRNGKTDFMGVY